VVAIQGHVRAGPSRSDGCPPVLPPAGVPRLPLGEPIVSMAITNLRQAYGLDLLYLKDCDECGWPDVTDPLPNEPGIK